MKLTFLLVLLSSQILCFADDVAPPPATIKSTKVTTAYKTYEAEMKRLKDLQDKATESYRATLKQAEADAMKAGKAEEYEAIKVYIAGEVPQELAKEDKPAMKIPGVLEDVHMGTAGAIHDANEYNLELVGLAKKKTILVIDYVQKSKEDELASSFGEIKLNDSLIHGWKVNGSSEHPLEIDITKFTSGSLKKFKIAFKFKGGRDALNVRSVKAVYR